MFIVGVDLETTGLEETDEIVELGAVLFHVETQRVVLSYGKIFRVNDWSDDAAEVHKIPHELSNMMGYVSDDLLDPWKVIGGHLADYVVAHNASHDHKFIKKVWPSFLEKPWLCTKSDLKHEDKIRRVASTRLGHLCVDYGIQLGGWHQALADAEACARLAAQHDLHLAYQNKITPKYRLICSGDFVKNAKELLQEAPSVMEDKRKYRWNPNDDPNEIGVGKVWFKDSLLSADLENDAKYISKVTKGKWSFDFQDMPKKEY